jgi:hypothetical protein
VRASPFANPQLQSLGFQALLPAGVVFAKFDKELRLEQN